MNIGRYKEQLSEYMIYKKYSEKTIESYLCSIGKFLDHFKNEATKPSEISKRDIIKYLSQFESHNTHKAYLSAIKLFYTKVGNQPLKLKGVESPRESRKLPIVLSVGEIQTMFDVCENLKHKVILSLLYSSGIRASELINLEWKHLDRKRKVINIIGGKGNKDRQVIFEKSIIPLLEDYYNKYKPRPYILSGQTKEQYTIASLNKVVKSLAEKAGIKKRVYTHLIRHCMCTHLYEAGTDLDRIQKNAGHQNPKTTSIYCHISSNVISQIQSPMIGIRI